jgi:hypothetical protein
VDGNVVAGLGYWLGSYREWGPQLSRLSEQKLEIPMYWSELDWYGAYYVWWKTLSLLHLKVDEWGPRLDRLLQQNIEIPRQ